MDIHIIAAVAKNKVIGRNGGLPWHLPGDLKHFRQMTTGHTVIMGRRTFQSVGKPLPDRQCIVVSKSMTNIQVADLEIVSTLEDAFAITKRDRCFVVGGSPLYAQALAYANVLDLTRIDSVVDGDVFFPEVNWSDWTLDTRSEDFQENGLQFAFYTYSRRKIPLVAASKM